jgi:uncharacterized surface protein with fasciclin (FAS1) repeats
MSIAQLIAAAAAASALAGVAAAQTAPVRAAPATPAQPAVAATPATPGATAATPATRATPASPATAAKGDLVATAQAAGNFTTFLKAAEVTKLTPVLKSAGPITVFAPTDAAFAALPAGELDRLLKSPAELQKLLLAHVVNTKVTSDQIEGKKGEVQNGAGVNLALDGSGDGATVNGVAISQPDVLATNGVIHVIDRVILPAGATATANAATQGANASTTEAEADEAEPAGAAPATPARPAKAATPATPGAQPATPATPAQPATPATPNARTSGTTTTSPE